MHPSTPAPAAATGLLPHAPGLKNPALLLALQRLPAARRPIWLMRQAGRYLPEYMAVRSQAGSFMQLATTPELACEVTLQPLRRFDLDAAILFSDILTVPDAMGLGLRFEQGEGPVFERPLRDEAAIAALREPDLERLGYVFEAVRLIRRALQDSVPLIGFSGSPWSLAAYMIEGHGSADGFATTRRMLYQRPDLVERVLAVNTAAVTAYLNAQIEAGAQAVMLFDTWGGLLPHAFYLRHSLAPMRAVIAGLHRHWQGVRVPVILFTKGGAAWLEAMAASGADALGLDWTVSLAQAHARTAARVALQGNLDPLVLLSEPATVQQAVREVLQDVDASGSGGLGHVFNLGHGIMPQTPPENVAALVEAVRANT